MNATRPIQHPTGLGYAERVRRITELRTRQRTLINEAAAIEKRGYSRRVKDWIGRTLRTAEISREIERIEEECTQFYGLPEPGELEFNLFKND
jgi:predicted DNA-binding transcriptional regulator